MVGAMAAPRGCARKMPAGLDPATTAVVAGSFCSVAKTVGYDPAIFRKFRHHGLVKRNILFCAAVFSRLHAKLVAERLAGGQA